MGNQPQQITSRDILAQLRRQDKPAMTTGDLAEALDVSIQTVRNHIEGVEEYGRVKKSKIAGSTVYWIDERASSSVDFICHRCSREMSTVTDHAKLEMEEYFDGVKPYDVPNKDFYLLCRFCWSDLVSWLFSDDGSIGEYPFIDDWDVFEHQIEEAKADPDMITEFEDADDLAE